MGVNRLFWSQEMMDEWIVEEKVSIDNDVMINSDESRKYHIAQAVYFVADVADGTDPHGFVGKVKEIDSILKLGAEHYMDSVILGDVAYTVVQGFTGVLIPERTSTRVNDISTAVKTQAGETEPDDRELLASFLLNNL